jgi:hypothetical protein
MRRFVHDRLYPRAMAGLPGLGTPEQFAVGFRAGPGTLRERGERLVRRHIAVSSAAGFLGGVGGIFLMPITLPTNLAAVALVQLHMAASVAALAGRDPRSPAVQDAVLTCLLGATPPDETRSTEQETLDRLGLKLAERGLNTLFTAGVGLVGWAGRQAATALVKHRLVRGIPLVGGVLGAASDGYITSQVAKAALDSFASGARDDDGDRPPPSGDGVPHDVNVGVEDQG